jgi:hypothetical protein
MRQKNVWVEFLDKRIVQVLPGMWSTSLDLTDGYFHCPISVAFRKYLRFVWDNNVFQFRAVPSFLLEQSITYEGETT